MLEYLMTHLFTVSRMDHSQNDCLLIAILSHGELGYLYSRDTHYKLDSITGMFTADRCPTLAGKPKVINYHVTFYQRLIDIR